jgi:hypothetical protein
MRTVDRIVSRLVVIAVCACVAGCAPGSASIERTWVARDAQVGELHYVATLFVSRDALLRRSSEDRMANALRARGIRAVPSYVLLGAAPIDRDTATARLRAAHVDGIVTMRVVETGTQRRLVSRGVSGAGGFLWTRTKVVPTTVVQVETTAYSLRTHRVLWGSLSKSVDPGSVGELVRDVAQVVTRELHAQGLLSA